MQSVVNDMATLTGSLLILNTVRNYDCISL